MNKKYSPKELDIFGGVVSLMQRGESLYTLKVADIAAAAGVGKGTVYEYFASKEQIIAEAILYNMDREKRRCLALMGQEQSFQGKLIALLTVLEDNVSNKLSAINVLMSSGGNRDMVGLFHRYGGDACSAEGLVNPIFTELLSAGRAEGLITGDEISYQQMVLRGALAGYVFHLNNGPMKTRPAITNEQARGQVYRMMVKALAE